MRLLHHKNDGNVSLTDDIVQDIPAYAILSHTWGRDGGEVTFKDIQDDPEQAKSKAGSTGENFVADFGHVRPTPNFTLQIITTTQNN